MNQKVNDVVLEVSKDITDTLNAISLGQMENMTDVRLYQPFGPKWDYSKEKPILVTRQFAYDNFFETALDDEMNLARLNNWLAIVDHYGFHHDYDWDFMNSFFPLVPKALLKIFTDDDNTIFVGNRTIVPRLINGETYTRAEFVDKFLIFFEDRGFEF